MTESGAGPTPTQVWQGDGWHSDPRWVLDAPSARERLRRRVTRNRVPVLAAAIVALAGLGLYAVLTSGPRAETTTRANTPDQAAQPPAVQDAGTTESVVEQGDSSGPLRVGLPDDVPPGFPRTFPFPAPSKAVAWPQRRDAFTVVVYAEGVTHSDVVAFLEQHTADVGWHLEDLTAADPSARSLGTQVYVNDRGTETVTLEFYDPSGGDQLRFAEEFGVTGPWINVQYSSS